MNHIDELIETANKLCASLDKVANEDNRLSIDLSLILENYSHDVYRMTSDLREIKYELGV